jgi:uncharacterized membrane protein
MRVSMAALYFVAGVLHLTVTAKFLLIVPAWIPYPRETVVLTGVCELLGAVALFIPRLRTLAGVMLAAYAVAVFPANIKHAFEGVHVEGLPDSLWYHGPRLLLQPVLVWWALFASGVVSWPFRSPPRSSL